jgi:Flp pilus assembly protein TadG
MTRLARRAARRLRRLLAREDGTATVEFVVLFPVFMLVLVNAVEASVVMSRVAMLDRALDLAVRELRIGTAAPSEAS